MMASIRLQRTVGELEKYFHNWGLNINATKTKMKVFTPQNGNKSRNTERDARRVTLSIKGTKIFPSLEIKYLGITFSGRMKFKKHTDIIIKRAMGAFFKIAPVLKKAGKKPSSKRYCINSW